MKILVFFFVSFVTYSALAAGQEVGNGMMQSQDQFLLAEIRINHRSLKIHGDPCISVSS